jgi:hypothetical protein
MPFNTTQGNQLTGNQPKWWQVVGQGIQSVLGNVTFQSGPNGYSFSGSGGGNNILPTPPSTRDINSWLPYVVGGAVLLKLLKK